MGTPEFSVPVLESLIENTNVVLVVSQPDAVMGRKKVLTPSEVKKCALEHNIPVLTPSKIKNEYENILNFKPDIVITCAYGQLVPKQILDYPEYGCINVHASLLPKYRGASPINAVIYNGETETGITIMYMDETLDTGNIIHAKSIEIDDTDTLGTLTDKLSKLGATLLIKTLPSILDNTNFNIPQDNELATYTSLIKRSDERLDFTRTKKEIINHIRSLNPSPLANIVINNEEIKIVEARVGNNLVGEIGKVSEVGKDYFSINCSDGTVEILKIKPSGKNIMSVKDFFNGYDKNKLLNKKVGE